MDGLTALKQLRLDHRPVNFPVVIFSSLENPDIIRESYASGACLYLRKPLTTKEYYDVARFCLRFADSLKVMPLSFYGVVDVCRAVEIFAVNERL